MCRVRLASLIWSKPQARQTWTPRSSRSHAGDRFASGSELGDLVRELPHEPVELGERRVLFRVRQPRDTRGRLVRGRAR
jgi:hypothetical protein